MKKKYIIPITIGCLLLTLFWKYCGTMKREKTRIIVPEKLSVEEEQVLYENEQSYVDAQLLLTAKRGISYQAVEEMIKNEDGQIIGYISFSNDYQISFPCGKSYEQLNELINKWGKENLCESISLNIVHRISSESYSQDPWKDTNFQKEQSAIWNEYKPDGNNWWAEAIRMPSVWKKYDWNETSKESVKIGVIDSVFDEKHKELCNVFKKTWNNIDFEQEETTLSEKNFNHGTHVAGIIGAEMGNNYGISGIAACAKPELYGYACFGTKNYQYSTMMEFKYAIALMLEQGVKVINISLGFEELIFAAQQGNESALASLETYKNSMTKFLKSALEVGYDFLIIKSAGNTSGKYWNECKVTKDYPFGYKENSWGVGKKEKCSAKFDFLGAITDKQVREHMIIVGAAEQSGFSDIVGGTGYQIADYSNIDCDVYAPGSDILSTTPSDNFAFMKGTSMAAPIISGVAGLVWTVNSELSAVQVKNMIIASANYRILGINPIMDLEVGRKDDVSIVNAAFAVNLAKAEHGEAIEDNRNCGILMGRVSYGQDGEKCYLKNVEVYINEAETGEFVEKIASDEMGDIQVFLPVGKYMVCANDEKYGTAEIGIEVKEAEAVYLDIQLKSDLDTDNCNQSYMKILEECKNSINYDAFSENMQKACNGLIDDLNNDGIKELILNFCVDGGECCEIWTIKNNLPVCVFCSGLYFEDDGWGGYLDLMEFRGKTYLGQFFRLVQNEMLTSDNWVLFELTENGYKAKHELACIYEYDTKESASIPLDYWLDDCRITEEEFYDICPIKIADIIDLGGSTFDEDLLNLISVYYYDIKFKNREVNFETLESLLQEDDISLAENADLYSNFIRTGGYEKYIDYYYGEPYEYVMIDIGGTASKELIISSQSDVAGFFNTLIFSYEDVSKEIIFADRISHFSKLRFSEKYKAIEFLEYEPTVDSEESGFYILEGGKLKSLFYVGWHKHDSEIINYIRTADSSEDITMQQRNDYIEGLENIIFTKIL